MAIDNSYLAAVVYSDGETGTVFPVSWPRINDRHIRVFFDGGELTIDTDFTVDSNNVTLLTYIVDVQNELTIARFTPREDRAIVWGDGTPFVKAALDKEGLNIHYINQELFDWVGLSQTTIVGATGPQGPQGIQGPFGPQGPEGVTGPEGIQGVQGPDGPQGVTGEQGDIGVDGATGIQGVPGVQGMVGDAGADGSSFHIDEFGDLAGRDAFDTEPKGFTYYADDVEVGGNETAKFQRFVGDGSSTAFDLSFIPDGEQSIQVVVSGVGQLPDNYTFVIATSPEKYTLVFSEAPAIGINFAVREFSIASGFGAIYIKDSATSGDWGDAIPFGRGPRGDQGPQGITGIQGPQGPFGPAGIQGPQGITGIDGPQGPQGVIGVQGPQGDQGSIGPSGAQGPVGTQGPVGPNGPDGDQGITGNAGADGAEGRSSSGKIYTGTTASMPVNTVSFNIVTMHTFNITQSKTFNRTLKIEGLWVSHGLNQGGLTLAFAAATYGGSTAAGGITRLDTAVGSETRVLGALYLLIPPNTTGQVVVSGRTSYNSSAGCNITGGPFTVGISPSNKFEVTIIPESLELS